MEKIPPPVATQWAPRRLPPIAMARPGSGQCSGAQRGETPSGSEVPVSQLSVSQVPGLKCEGSQVPSVCTVDVSPRFTLWRRVRRGLQRQCPLTGSVSRAMRERRFLSTRSCLGRINAIRTGEEACAERISATILEPGARPRIQRGELR